MFSVVACVRNRAENVRLWLKSLALQTRADLMEVILVDYSSTDNLQEVLEGAPIKINLFNVASVDQQSGFPEAFLKNVGIRRASQGVIACTNVDCVYEPTFFENLIARCGPGVLIQAVRKDAIRDQGVAADAVVEKFDDPKKKISMVVDHLPDTGCPIVAGADCQIMTREAWHIFQGYDEDLTGWGSLDSDVMMRALLLGMTLIIVGHRHAHYVHTWHDKDMVQNQADVERNHQIIMSKRGIGTIKRNRSDWGGVSPLNKGGSDA